MKKTANALEYLIPAPKSVKIGKGEFRIDFKTRIVLSDTCDSRDFGFARILKNDIEEKLGIRLSITKTGSGESCGSFFIKKDSTLSGEEAYILTVSDKAVEICASTNRGILYGIQTLRQIISLSGGLIPACIIEDEPLIPNRGFYHDATRGRVQKLSSYKKLADICSYFKLNQLQLYVEHTFAFEGFSEVYRDDTPLTAEDILELDEYCFSLGIELIPSFSTFGHLYKVLRTKTYEELCELDNPGADKFSFDQRMQHHTLDVTNEKSIEFVKKMLDEVLPLFRSDYVNICADETFDLGKGKSKALADEVGIARIYVDFINKIMHYCILKGKKPMFWGDIIVGFPEYVGELPKDVICLNWGYSDCEKEDNTRKLAEVPVRQYLCPGVHGWRHMINHLEMAYKNISVMCSYALKYKAEGFLNTDWGDYGHLQDPLFSVPGLIYGAAFSWSGVKDEDEINRQISRLYYGDDTESIVCSMRELAMLEASNWEQFVQFIELMQKKPARDAAKEFYDRLTVKDPFENNKKIDEKTAELLPLLAGVGTEGRELITRLVLFAEGQKLMCKALYQMGQKIFAGDTPKENTNTATELEEWLYHYKQVWRITSKESELYRISNIFCRAADILREKNTDSLFE
ncbi:MAG: family 20 glycosylhydrolase [Butyrivibrio sp.]|nr:family 20 glycosylhydrolase [Butyrivibrio sp.]